MAEAKVLNDEIVGSFEKADKAWIVWDKEVSGFGVRVLPSGVRSWIVGYWGIRPGGKKGSRRLVIGRHGEMRIEEARRKAQEILAHVASDDEPDGRSGEAAVEADGEPDADAAPSMEEEPDSTPAPPAETAPGAGADAEPAAVALTPAGEQYDRETGEILSARENSTEYSDPDEDLGDYEDGASPAPGQNPEETDVRPGVEESVVGHIIGATVDGGARDEEYESVADAEQKAAAVPVRDREVSPEAERETGTENPDGGAGGNAAEDGADETEGEAPRPGRAGRARGAVAGAAGKMMGLGRALKPAGREKRVAKEERVGAGQGESEPAASEESGETGKAHIEPSGEPKLDAKTKVGGAVEEESRDGNMLSEESVSGLAQNLEGIRGVVDRIEAWSEKVGSQMELLSGSAAVMTVDRRQKWRRMAKAVLAIAVAAAIGLAAGVAVQSRLEVVPQVDPTLGWRDHIWDHYGSAFTGCYDRARKDDSGRVKCEIEVRAR